MVRESYQEKLGRQFARYAAGMALFFFSPALFCKATGSIRIFSHPRTRKHCFSAI